MIDRVNAKLDVLATRSLTRRAALKAGFLGAAGIAGAHVEFGGAPGVNAQDQTGGILTIGKPYELTGFDPAPEGNQTSWEIHALVYESLVFLDENLAPIPGLAESWETPDSQTFVFHLRQGVTFHNGREMTADDVVFSLKRVLELPAAFWDAMMGPTLPVGEGTPTGGGGIGLTLEATSPYVVTARLSEPYAPFLQAMSGTDVSIVPAAEVLAGAVDLTKEFVGTGLFKLTSTFKTSAGPSTSMRPTGARGCRSSTRWSGRSCRTSPPGWRPCGPATSS